VFEFLRSIRKPTRTHKPRHARLWLESLERREVPAALSLAVAYNGGKVITLSGTLSDHNNPSMQMINITGKASGMASTNAQGQFSVQVTATDLGNVTATVGDNSATTTVALTDVTPSLTLFASEGNSGQWTLSGTVTYARPKDTMMVMLSGNLASTPVQLTTTPNSSGDYSFQIPLNGTASDNGTIGTYVTTAWGTASDWAYVNIHQTGT